MPSASSPESAESKTRCCGAKRSVAICRTSVRAWACESYTHIHCDMRGYDFAQAHIYALVPGSTLSSASGWRSVRVWCGCPQTGAVNPRIHPGNIQAPHRSGVATMFCRRCGSCKWKSALKERCLLQAVSRGPCDKPRGRARNREEWGHQGHQRSGLSTERHRVSPMNFSKPSPS